MPLALENYKQGLKEYEIVALCGNRTGIKKQELIAAMSYELADAMMAQRRKRSRTAAD